jgi:hypothetical protein
VPALILSLKVRDNLKNGNIIGATKNSKTSKTLNILATTGLVILFALSILYVLINLALILVTIAIPVGGLHGWKNSIVNNETIRYNVRNQINSTTNY